MRKIIFTTLSIFILIIVVSIIFFWGKRYVITIPENVIQEKVNSKFPMIETYLLLLEVEYSNPIIELQDKDNKIKMGITANSLFKINNKQYSGNILVSGGLEYNPDKAEFYMNDFTVHNININGFPVKYTDKINSLTKKALTKYFNKWPIYTLGNDDPKQLATKLTLKNIAVKNKNLVVTLGIGR